MKTTATNQKISWFSHQQKTATLNLAPSFQRKPVWSDDQASYLIDTVLEALPFPEIYLRSSSDTEGNTRYEVVDGQQRIRSLLRFADDDLVLSGEHVSAKWEGRRFSDLSPAQKIALWDYEVVVRDLGGASDGEIRDLFRRLNINQERLTAQEIRHATYTGHFLKLVESLADDEWWVDSKIVNVREVRRQEDVEYIAELLVGLMAGPKNKKQELEDYFSDFDKDFPEKKEWEGTFKKTRDLLHDVLGDEGVKRWRGKSDFYSIFLLFGVLVERGKVSSRSKAPLRTALMDFKAKVDEAKKKAEDKRRGSREVLEYTENVTRAASDLSRRTRRLEILEAVASRAGALPRKPRR